MAPVYHLIEHHLFEKFGKNILFNVESMLFYEVAPVVADLVPHLRNSPSKDPVKALKGKYPKTEIQNALLYLEKEGFLRKTPFNARPPVLKKRWGIRHLELMVTHACNMGCRYCYGAHGVPDWKDSPHLYGAQTSGMSLDTAKAGVDFLFRESGPQKDLSVIFFGGEPLLAFDLIQKIVPYIREKEAETGKMADLSLSTNGLLLNQKIVDFLVKHKIGCQVSIDGPREIQDANRCLRDGSGSYDRILPGIKALIAARPGRAPARVTVARGRVFLPKVAEHLLALGFGSVHIEPDIGNFPETAVTENDVAAIKGQNEALAAFLVKSVRGNRYFNYTNLVRFIRQTRVIQERLAHHCGAGRTYFALSQDGAFYPCHRFVGMDEFRMGDLDGDMDVSLTKKILNLTVDNRPVCRACWARYLCGGGCWKHAVDRNGSLEIPDEAIGCEIIRHTIECAMAVNTELKVRDKDILSDIYEKTAEPYLVPEEDRSGNKSRPAIRDREEIEITDEKLLN